MDNTNDFLNLYAPVNELGYGIFTRGLVKGLGDCGFENYHLTPIGQPQGYEDSSEQKRIERLMSNFWNRTVPSVIMWHEFDLNKFCGNKLIAFPQFETTKFNAAALNYLAQMDAIFAQTHFAKSVIENNIGSKTPVIVVQPGATQYSDVTVAATKKSNVFTFLSVGKLEVRKSQKETVDAYFKVFEKSSIETRLICHCYNPFFQDFNQMAASLLQACGAKIMQSACNPSLIGTKGNAVVEIPLGHISRQQLFQLYKIAHIGVFPSKAEGWNFPLMEAIQAGVPSIATFYSSHTEYLTPEYYNNQELLLTNHKLVTANDGLFFKGDRGNWATVDVEELAEKMKYAAESYTDIMAKFDKSKMETRFNWENCAKSFLEGLKAVS